MLLRELFDRNIPDLQNLDRDNSAPKLTRRLKSSLSLRQIRRLRKMQDLRTYEHHINLEKVRTQYKPAAQPGPGF